MWKTYKKEIAKTLNISYPIIIAQIGTVLMGVTDNIMVGKLGENLGATALAAAGIANVIFFLIAVIGIGILSAISPLVAMAKGKNNEQECGLLLYSGMKLSITVGIILMAIVLIISENFEIFQQKAEITNMAKSYLRIIAFSMVPMTFFMAVKQFSDGLSVTRPAMYITIIGLSINIFFNWILIYGNLGFSPMYLYGAGLSTLIARVSMACMMIVYVMESSFFQGFLPNVLEDHSTKFLSKKILKIGIPSGMQYFFELGAFSGAAVMVGWLGVNQLAAHQIALNLSTITYMVAAGFSSAGSIMVGNAVGLKDRKQVVRAGTITLTLAGIFMLISGLVFLIMQFTLVRMYIDNEKVTYIAASLLFIAAFYQLSDGIQAVGLGILRGIGDVNTPTIITLFAYWVVGLPVGYILGFKYNWDVQGIWVGLLLGLTISAILLTTRFYLLSYNKKKYDL